MKWSQTLRRRVMKSRGDKGSVRPAGQTRTDGQNSDDQSAVVGNERLTALAGAVLLVKLGSTFPRFLRSSTKSPAFVRKGPPRLPLRVLAPLLIATTLVVIGSGIGLVVTGPSQAGPLLPLHGFSVLVWLPLIAIHVFAYIWRTPRLVADDWSKPSAEQAPGRGRRLGVNLGALLAAPIAAILLVPRATPWAVGSQTNGTIPAPMIVGLLVAALALLVTRPLRWR